MQPDTHARIFFSLFCSSTSLTIKTALYQTKLCITDILWRKKTKQPTASPTDSIQSPKPVTSARHSNPAAPACLRIPPIKRALQISFRKSTSKTRLPPKLLTPEPFCNKSSALPHLSFFQGRRPQQALPELSCSLPQWRFLAQYRTPQS